MNPNNAKNQKSSKLPEIIAVVLVLGAIGYYFYSSSGSSAAVVTPSFTIASATSSVGTDVLTLLNQIHSLRIDTSLFQSPAYQSLTDFTVQVPLEPIGKSNPFVTGPALNAVSSSSTATTVLSATATSTSTSH